MFDSELGELPGIQHLKLKPESQPSVMANRRVPLALIPILKTELDKLTPLGVITPVEEATTWVSQFVVTHKKSGDLRVCLDQHELNKCILSDTSHSKSLRIYCKNYETSTFSQKLTWPQDTGMSSWMGVESSDHVSDLFRQIQISPPTIRDQRFIRILPEEACGGATMTACSRLHCR